MNVRKMQQRKRMRTEKPSRSLKAEKPQLPSPIDKIDRIISLKDTMMYQHVFGEKMQLYVLVIKLQHDIKIATHLQNIESGVSIHQSKIQD